jgi:hypothetical protein
LKTIHYLRMMRPANIVTSVSDILAGIAISGFFMDWSFKPDNVLPVLYLCLSTMGLYGGGIVFNDVFDADLDKIERPERAIPSGIISIKAASILGGLLLLFGVVMASLYSVFSGILALLIAIAALSYNKFSKHHSFLGPLNMGICRGLNLLLGLSISMAAFHEWYFLAIVPIIYIFSITMISRGEVHGGNTKSLFIAAILYFIVIVSIIYFGIIKEHLLLTSLFVLFFMYMIFKPLIIATRNPIGKNIGKAVKAGVISLIIMNAAWAAAFSSLSVALLILCLLPISLAFAKFFAVT